MKLRTVVKKLAPVSFVKVLTPIGHWCEAVIASVVNGFPAFGLHFVGVTGTNGKTSTTIMIAHILREAGYPTGMSTTAIVNDGKNEYENDLDGGLTNATPFTMQKLLRTMRRNGVKWVSIEAGSQGLHQYRLLGFKFDGAVITNLTNEHLDYHGTMENYAAAKSRLFAQAKGGVLVTNADDEWADYFYKQGLGTRLTYGKKSKDFHLISVDHDQKYSFVNFEHKGEKRQLKLKVQGDFNAYNALAATAVTTGLGIDFTVIKEALESLERIPGRMDAVNEGQDFRLVVDYAHTPDAIKNILTAAKALTTGKLICISGAAGERPISRRAPVAKIASEISDVFIITDDEPFSENPVKIREEVKTGIQTGPNMAETIEVADRTDAIKKAVSIARKGDTIVIAGMGHQKYRSGPNGKEKWDDFAVAQAVLRGELDPLTINWRSVMHDHYPDLY